MHLSPKNKAILIRVCNRAIARAADSRRRRLTAFLSVPRQRPEFTPHLELIQSENKFLSELQLAEKYGLESSYIHRLLVGQRPLTEGVAARIEAANPQSWFRWAPPVPTIAHSPAPAAGSDDLTAAALHASQRKADE
jgi:hypothetical protein